MPEGIFSIANDLYFLSIPNSMYMGEYFRVYQYLRDFLIQRGRKRVRNGLRCMLLQEIN